MVSFTQIALASAASAALVNASGHGHKHKEYTFSEYEVKITNLAFNQPLSRPVVFTHNENFELFQFNGQASKGLRIVAEDGNPDVLEAEAEKSKDVNSKSIVVGEMGIPPRQSQTLTLKTTKDYPLISMASMAINTNDCFVAVNGENIYDYDKEYMWDLPGLDAGTEANNELCTHMPGPACLENSGNLRDEAGSEGFIHVHRGVHGVQMFNKTLEPLAERANGGPFAPQFYDWRNPMVRFEVVKTKECSKKWIKTRYGYKWGALKCEPVYNEKY
eukprot:Pgem_evm1s18821